MRRASPRPPEPPHVGGPQPAGLLKRSFIRYVIRFFVGCYLRVRREGFDGVPEPPYLLVFNHPNWVDPFLLASEWPRRHTLFIFGPKEEDMAVGWKNSLITWGRMAVPFKPSKSDLIDTTRRATSVLKAGHVLAIAGEGRLSDREGELVPLQDGAAFFALRARVPIVPLAIIGTRWLRFGKIVMLRAGDPISTAGRRPDREGVETLTADLQAALEKLLAGVGEDPPPGRFGRWMTDIFNERPWLTETQPSQTADVPGQAREDERR